MASHSSHGITIAVLATMSSISQASCASPFKFVQIKPLPNETNQIDILFGLSREKICNHKKSHAPPCADSPQLILPRTAMISSCAPHPSATRADLSALLSIDLWSTKIQSSPDPARALTCLLDSRLRPYMLVIEARAGRPSHAPSTHRRTLLTSLDNVITPRQQQCKHIHISPSHVNAMS